MPYKDKATYNEYMRNYYHTKKGHGVKKPLSKIKEELDTLRSENAILKNKLKQGPDPNLETEYNETDYYSDSDSDIDSGSDSDSDIDYFSEFDTQTLETIYDNIKNFSLRNEIDYDEVQRNFILKINKNAVQILDLLNDDERIIICNYLKSKAVLLWCNSYRIRVKNLIIDGKYKP